MFTSDNLFKKKKTKKKTKACIRQFVKVPTTCQIICSSGEIQCMNYSKKTRNHEALNSNSSWHRKIPRTSEHYKNK